MCGKFQKKRFVVYVIAIKNEREKEYFCSWTLHLTIIEYDDNKMMSIDTDNELVCATFEQNWFDGSVQNFITRFEPVRKTLRLKTHRQTTSEV